MAGRWPLKGEQAGQREQAEQGDQPLVGGQAVQGELAGYHILIYMYLSFQPNFFPPVSTFMMLPDLSWCFLRLLDQS